MKRLTKKWYVFERFSTSFISNLSKVMPGDNVELVCDLVHNVAAEVGTRFTLREGGKNGE